MIITAEQPGKCRRCKRHFDAGERIEYSRGKPILCEPCAGAEPEPVGAAASSSPAYSFQRGEQSGFSRRAQPADEPRQPAAAAAASGAPLASMFREQQLGELLERLVPLLIELRDSLRQRQPQ